jgi:hypothetical protein
MEFAKSTVNRLLTAAFMPVLVGSGDPNDSVVTA